jgi:transcriptional regulator with XRE-family HTH domain
MSSDRDVLRIIGNRIKELRIENGFTSYENFAFEHDLSARYYWGVENGRNISIKYLLKLLDIFSVDIKEFFQSIDLDTLE